MRQAADILSSAPAMQIRYLEAMQAMAKSSNSKVIFMPSANSTMPSSAAFGASLSPGPGTQDETDAAFQQAINARVIENI